VAGRQRLRAAEMRDPCVAALDEVRELRSQMEKLTGPLSDALYELVPTLPAEERRAAVRVGWSALAVGGHLVVVAHDSTNLTEGTGGPQDPSVLYTAEDVLADLAGHDLEVVRAGRVAREVPVADDHGGTTGRVAWDTLVRLVRR